MSYIQMSYVMWLVVTWAPVRSQDYCSSCVQPVIPTITVSAVTDLQQIVEGSLVGTFEILDPNDVSNGTAVCFNMDINAGLGTTMDLCSVSATTRFIASVTIVCGNSSATASVLGTSDYHTTTLNLSHNDAQCLPGRSNVTCSLCLTAPGSEINLFGVQASACSCCVDCVVASWSSWGTCVTSPQTCGAGMETRTREITTQNNDCGVECPVLIETRPCNVSCCTTPAQQTLDCGHNRASIAKIEITGMPRTEAVFQLDPWFAVSGCNKSLVLAKNSAGQNGLLLTLTNRSNIHEVCIQIRLCVTVRVVLSGLTRTTTSTRGCSLNCRCPDCRCYSSVCWDFPDPVGAEGIDTIAFQFIDIPRGNEWMVRGIYVITCPTGGSTGG